MKSKVLQNKEEKKEKLLEAAFYLMTRKDLQDISISELAKEAGIAKGTFYLYFKDKYDLRDFLVSVESSRILNQAMEALEANDIRNFEDAIVFLINQILIQLESNPLILHFIRMNLSWGVFNHHLSTSLDEDAMNLIPLFSRKAEEAGYHYENPAIILFMILELTSSVCFNCIQYRIPDTLEHVKPALYESIRAILKQGK